MAKLEDQIADLRVSQGETKILVQNLLDRVDKYVIGDDERHHDLMEFRVESSRHLAEVATIVSDMKRRVDCAVDISIPALQQTQSGQAKSIEIHTWLLRAVITVTLLAVLGGTVTSLATCGASADEAPQAEAAEEIVESPYEIEDTSEVGSDIF